MKQFTKLIIGSVFALALLISGPQAFAQEDTSSLRDKIAELRETHKDLKAQVEAGELTAEEARAQWQDMMAEVRAEKEAHFEAKIERVEAKYAEILENNPERAAIFKEHIDAVKERREEAVEKRNELRSKVESGEITRKEATQMRVEFAKTQKEKFQDIRNSVKEKRNDYRALNKENRPTTGARPAGGVGQRAGFVKNSDIDGE